MFAIRHGYDITWLVAEVPSSEYPGWFDHTLVNPGLLRQHPPLTFEAIEEAHQAPFGHKCLSRSVHWPVGLAAVDVDRS